MIKAVTISNIAKIKMSITISAIKYSMISPPNVREDLAA